MSPTVSELLFELLNVTLLAAGLGWLLFKPVRAALAAEAEDHAARTAALDARQADLDAATTALQAREAAATAQAQAQATRLLDAARDEAQSLRDAAAADQQARTAAWETEAIARQAAAAREAAAATAHVVAEAVRRLLGQVAGPELELALLRTALDAVDAAAALAGSHAGRVDVELAAPPTDAAQAVLSARLPPDARVVVRPELVAGARIATGVGLVDATALGLARQAADTVADQLVAPPTDATTPAAAVRGATHG
ncbi:MAG: hypothetical protein H6733_16895 [Alphaproteobacteria bacterium]|nr:hypothetical protein [Alphaproteobacteria bacterium]